MELAAFSSRLPHDKMTFEEVNLFHDIVDEDGSSYRNTTQIESYKTFLFIRNKIVIVYFKLVNMFKNLIHSNLFISYKCG